MKLIGKVTAAAATLLGLLLLGAGAGAGYLAWELGRPLQPGAPEVEFRVERGKSLLSVAADLEDRGLVRHAWTFRLLSRLAAERAPVQAGVFALSAAKSPAELFEHLRFGQPILRQVTIPEGLTLDEISQLLEARLGGSVHADEALGLMRDPDFAHGLGVPQATLEGYLLPETYSFPDEMPVRKILEVLVQSHFKALPADWRAREAALGLSHHQLVTLASLVEAETPLDEEKPLVAEVFYQRHKKHMLLQCDPTTVYGIPGFHPPITKKDLEREHPYNTYLHPGLPPGPINNPGRQALLAALAPAHQGYFYFVARADGSRGHFFSKTLGEHNQAVAVYRQRLQSTRQGGPR
jgi:peptidoglycan lytic transglycosylase G